MGLIQVSSLLLASLAHGQIVETFVGSREGTADVRSREDPCAHAAPAPDLGSLN